jgi:ribose 5-phosphate isomerase B
MSISIGADHKGFELKEKIKMHFNDLEWLDVGTQSTERTDYPIYAKSVCNNIINNRSDLGILICGSGIGISIAANRFKHIYAGLCWNNEVAQQAKAHDGINVLVLPAEFLSDDDAFQIIQTWLTTEFNGGRYQRRLEMMDV